jgi:hypothetical protein
LRNPIKLMIQKKHRFSESFARWYTQEKMLLDDHSSIKTEAQLCGYMYRKYGAGRFMVLAYQKGYSGFWCFWLGEIFRNGFVREGKKNVEADKLQSQLKTNKSLSYEERENIEEEIADYREMNQMEKRFVRRGPTGLKKAKVGVLNSFEET